MDRLVAGAKDAFDPETRTEFERRLSAQATALREDLASGRLDSDAHAVGLELEAYAVDETGRLAPVPESVFEGADCDAELGRHNVEINTPATPFDPAGLDAQVTSLRSRVEDVRETLAATGHRLVLDGTPALPPAEGTVDYFGATRERDGVVIAERMHPNPRYCAIDNAILRRLGGAVELSVPGVDRSFPTILFESLATSIQPHLQIPSVEAFPRAFNAAIRTMGPVLSLSANSPLLPADLYGDDPSVVDRTYHELRVPVFEQSINAAAEGQGKVKVPRDVERPTDVVDRVVADEVYAPALIAPADRADGYRGEFPEFDHQRGVYWRWVRGVIGGQPVGTNTDGTSLRIEYRPLPTQPTVADTVALQWLVAGLLRGLAETDHPLPTLDWSAARDAFYAAVRDGPTADLAWVTADGERTTDSEAIYDDLFATARTGLREAGVDDATIDDRLAPVERRRRSDGPAWTPSAWKLDRVRTALDAGATLPAAIERMQGAYVERSAAGQPLVEWEEAE